ncbi:hypothetical protein D3C72_1454780 [compost metagenome]
MKLSGIMAGRRRKVGPEMRFGFGELEGLQWRLDLRPGRRQEVSPLRPAEHDDPYPVGNGLAEQIEREGSAVLELIGRHLGVVHGVEDEAEQRGRSSGPDCRYGLLEPVRERSQQGLRRRMADWDKRIAQALRCELIRDLDESVGRPVPALAALPVITAAIAVVGKRHGSGRHEFAQAN